MNGYAATFKSFIFSLVDKEGLAPFKSMVKQNSLSSYAIHGGSRHGPFFGRGYDIYIADNANQNSNSHTNFGDSYSPPNGVTDRFTILAGTHSFSPDEVEVFYLAWIPLSFLFPCPQKPSELKEKLHLPPPKKKNHFKTYYKAESIGITQHFDYSTFDSYSFSLLFKLNGTHVRSRWSVTRSEAVCESIVVFNRYPGHQKQMYLNLAITDFPDYFTRFGATMVPNTGLARDAHRSPICVYIWFTRPHVAYLNRVCPSTLKNA